MGWAAHARAFLENVRSLEELHDGSLSFPVAQATGDVPRIFGKRIEAGVVHAGGNVIR
jgi:hypothetical protein